MGALYLFNSHDVLWEVARDQISLLKLQLPPIFGNLPISSCAILTITDILIPIVYLVFLYDFGQFVSSDSYIRAGMLSYILGLILNSVALVFFRSQQPALFYIGPLLILATLIVSKWRSELALISEGVNPKQPPSRVVFEGAPELSDNEFVVFK